MAARDERICCAVRVHKHGLKEVADFVVLECSTISIIANRTAKVKKHQE
jgi:hypothetical protein